MRVLRRRHGELGPWRRQLHAWEQRLGARLRASWPVAGACEASEARVAPTVSHPQARFNVHMGTQTFDETEAALEERVRRCEAHFDSRVFSLPDEAELARASECAESG